MWSACTNTSGETLPLKTTHCTMPVPSRTSRKCSLPLDRRRESQPRMLAASPTRLPRSCTRGTGWLISTRAGRRNRSARGQEQALVDRHIVPSALELDVFDQDADLAKLEALEQGAGRVVLGNRMGEEFPEAH